MRVHVRNDEPVPGLVRVSTDRPGFITQGTVPIRIPATTSMEVGLVLSEPPDQLWLHSYWSQNRRSIRIRLLDFDPVEIVRQEPLAGGRPSNWRPRSHGIVVDDLDAGFAVVGNDSGVRLGGSGSGDFGWQIDVDQGLPVWEQQRDDWFRPQVPSAWGKYRQTAALVSAGSGDQQVTFEAVLDGPGRWQLAYHIPDRHLPPLPGRPDSARTVFGALGSVDMRLEGGGFKTPIRFDAGAAEVGWNKVGEFDLDHRTVRLVVSKPDRRRDGGRRCDPLVTLTTQYWERIGSSVLTYRRRNLQVPSAHVEGRRRERLVSAWSRPRPRIYLLIYTISERYPDCQS